MTTPGMPNVRMAMDFVTAAGDAVERARLQFLLAGERPAPVVVAQLFAGQRPDGGWSPFWAEDDGSLDATCFRLARAEQLGLGPWEGAVAHAIAFLALRQADDGSWEEATDVAGVAPPWVKPGDLPARLYLTANCGSWSALMGGADAAGRAADVLQAHMDSEGRLPGFLHTHWLAGSLWYALGRREAAERVFGYLGSRVDEMAASQLAWLVTATRAAGVSTDHPLVREAIAALALLQEDDGRWRSDDGATQGVHTTLEALRALLP